MNMKMKIGAVTLACAITIGSTPFSVIAAAIPQKKEPLKIGVMSDTHYSVSYTHLTLPTTCRGCRSRWSPYH